MRLLNFTPHPLVIYVAGEVVFTAPSVGGARCEEDRVPVPAVQIWGDGMSSTTTVPVTLVGFGTVVGLPGPVDGVGYVVSRATAEALPRREDVYYPDGVVRDDQGRIIGCTGLGRVMVHTRDWPRCTGPASTSDGRCGQPVHPRASYCDLCGADTPAAL